MQTNKLRYWKWAAILLGVLNIFTIGSFVYHRYTETKVQQPPVIDNGAGSRLNGRFFRHEIGFDEAQIEQMRIVNQTYNPKANRIVMTIDSLKLELFAELNRTNPDSVKLDLLSDEIGNLHAALKKNTNRYYLKIQSMATLEQSEKIKEAFFPLFEDENLKFGKGIGKGKGRGRNYVDENKNDSCDYLENKKNHKIK